MITIDFESPTVGLAKSGPAVWFRVAANGIAAGPEEEPVAGYEDHGWHIGGKPFASFEVSSACKLWAETDDGPLELIGTYDNLRFDGDVLRTRKDPERPVARMLDHNGEWFVYPLASRCPRLIVETVK